MDKISTQIDDAAEQTPRIDGAFVGEIVRRHGRLTERRGIRVERVIEQSPDLAVADRLGYLWTGRMRKQTAVVERGGWYFLVELSEYLTRTQVRALAHDSSPLASVRLMSIVDNNGVLPLVAPESFAEAL